MQEGGANTGETLKAKLVKDTVHGTKIPLYQRETVPERFFKAPCQENRVTHTADGRKFSKNTKKKPGALLLQIRWIQVHEK